MAAMSPAICPAVEGPALAKTPPRGAGKLGLRRRDRNHHHGRAVKEEVELAAACLAPLAFEHNRGLEQRCGRDETHRGLGDGQGEHRALGLTEQNRRQGGGVDHHQVGRPSRS